MKLRMELGTARSQHVGSASQDSPPSSSSTRCTAMATRRTRLRRDLEQTKSNNGFWRAINAHGFSMPKFFLFQQRRRRHFLDPSRMQKKTTFFCISLKVAVAPPVSGDVRKTHLLPCILNSPIWISSNPVMTPEWGESRLLLLSFSPFLPLSFSMLIAAAS